MKRISFLVIVLILLLALSACQGDEQDDVTDVSEDYVLEIVGIEEQPIEITKGEILEIAKDKSVICDDDNPCSPSDKTDDDGNLERFTLKGVYLDDILEVYADGVSSNSFSVMTLRATDNYHTIITSEVFNETHGGSKAIIAYEYDGHVLNENEKSGALRVVFPDQAKNSWVSKIKVIEFSNVELTLPTPENVVFMEPLSNEYYGSFEQEVITDNDTYLYTYNGISLEKLFDGGILTAEEEDKMYFSAWDFVSDGENSFYKEYSDWTIYEFYHQAFLVYSSSLDGVEEALGTAPVFKGENIGKGMTVKNTLALMVGDNALVSLEIAFERFDTSQEMKIDLIDLLSLLNMEDSSASYRIYDAEDNHLDITYSEAEQAYIEKSGDEYVLKVDEQSLLINKISIKK